MSKGIAITGMGIISAIGNNVAENYQSLINEKKGITRISKIKTNHVNDIMVGEIAFTNQELEYQLRLTSDNNYSRTALLGAIAAKEAIKDAHISDINAHKTGLISATSVGGMDMTERYYYDYLKNKTVQKYIEGHHAGDSTQKIAEQLGIEKSLVTTISTACSSAANAIMLGARLIKSGELDRVIVGGSDCLSKFTINGFKTLMILSDTYNTPFDDNRKGLNLGEAAAFLVLESDAVVKAENKKVLAYVKGYGNANDAFHQTASSDNGDGATLAMQKALNTANYLPKDIDYVNAHGTATGNNDLSEGRAIIRVFGDAVPDFSSTKAYTGHTLAAAGAIEAVYSVLALQNNVIYPNLNFKTQMKEFNITPQLKLKEKALQTVMSNSFGFGGNCSTVIFSTDLSGFKNLTGLKKVYINSIASISAQKTFDNTAFLNEFVDYEANVINAVDPIYKDYIAPAAARRMAKGVKMGVVASKIALQNAGLKNVDAIITGTGMGCVRDSEKFVSAIIDDNEQYLTPTSFIQSTHNTVGGQIALELKCKGYNFTYVHASNSFESAFLDAKLQLELNEETNILIGGVDELGDHTVTIHKLINHIKPETVKASELLKSNTEGAVFSEGANFFVLSNEKQNSSYAEVVSIKTYNTLPKTEVAQAASQFLNSNNLKVTDIDLIILGNNGDISYDSFYDKLTDTLFSKTQQVYYKHLCGEFNTASSFGVWLASKILKTQTLPEIVKLNNLNTPAFKTVLLYNQYRGENHSFTLLKQC